MNNLSNLLKQASKLFKVYKGRHLMPHTFCLVNKNGLWRFDVINSWGKWVDKKLCYQFGWFQNPENAVKAFLCYVEQNKILVKKLQH